MKIQIVSDIHLEFYEKKSKYNFIKPSAPILCILGDLGRSEDNEIIKIKSFFDEISKLFEIILWVPGNHEYYQGSSNIKNITNKKITSIIDKKYFKLCSLYKNIKYLKRKVFEIKYKNINYKFIGCTLWTKIPERLGIKVMQSMTDYDEIYVLDNKTKKPKKITYKNINLWHRKDLNFILDELKISVNNKNKIKNIVLTHHKPFQIPSDCDNEVSMHAYESDQTEILKLNLIDAWFYGHTHKRFKKRLKGSKTIFVSNPKGYPYQRTEFNNMLFVSI